MQPVPCSVQCGRMGISSFLKLEHLATWNAIRRLTGSTTVSARLPPPSPTASSENRLLSYRSAPSRWTCRSDRTRRLSLAKIEPDRYERAANESHLRTLPKWRCTLEKRW